MKRFLDLIGSRRFAIWLLLITTATILFSNLLPKPYILTEQELRALKVERPAIHYLSTRFNTAAVTKSPYFVVVAAFLFASITVCTIRRARRRLEAEDEGIPPISTLPVKYDLGTVMQTLDLSHKTLDAKPKSSVFSLRSSVSGMPGLPEGWRWQRGDFEERKVFYARKGEGGFWGSAAFHAGMCMILVGALISAFTRFNGRLVLTEGFDIEPPRILKGLSENDRYVFPIRAMALESFVPVYREGFPLDYAGNLINRDFDGRIYREVVKVNEPMRSGGYQFLLSRYGFAPRFVIKDRDGKIVSDDIVNLVVFKPEQADQFPILNGEVRVKARFFPDFYIDTFKGQPATRSRVPNRPVFLISLERGGRNIGGGFVPMGKALDFNGHSLEFKDLRYWVQLDVSRDSGVPVITFGFFVIIAGLSWRILLNEKSIWIIIRKAGEGMEVGVGGRARFFPALFEEELRRMAEELQGESEFRSQESEG